MFWPSGLKFWGPLLGCCAPFPSAASVSGGQRFACVLPGCSVPFPSAASGPGSQRLGALSTGTPCLFPPRQAARAARGLPRPLPPRPQRAPPVGSQGVFRPEPGPVCRVGGGGFSGAEFAPFPSPASYLQRGWGGSSPEFLSPFVLRTAGGVFPPVNFSLALPQFKKISLRLLSGPSGRSPP